MIQPFSNQDLPSTLEHVLSGAREFALDNNSDAVVFLGQPADPIPRALIQDRDLPPWARLLWCYFRQLSDSPAMTGRMSDYDTIRERLGIGSRGTVAAALHALRVTRWVTLLPPQPAEETINSPNVYLLHNMPLTFMQAMELNPEYANHIADAVKSPNQSIRKLARRMLDGAMMSGGSGESENDISRIASFALPAGDVDRSWGTYQRSPMNPSEKETGEEDYSEVFGDEVKLNLHADILELSSGRMKLMEIKINEVEPQYRQAYLDELAVRYIEGVLAGKPLNDPVAYLMWQVNQHKRGEITLTGKGERLGTLLKRKEDEQKQVHDKNLAYQFNNLHSELQGIERFIKSCTDLGNEPEPWMIEDKRRIESQMNHIRDQHGAN